MRVLKLGVAAAVLTALAATAALDAQQAPPARWSACPTASRARARARIAGS